MFDMQAVLDLQKKVSEIETKLDSVVGLFEDVSLSQLSCKLEVSRATLLAHLNSHYLRDRHFYKKGNIIYVGLNVAMSMKEYYARKN